jgi:Kef-type K+ transport system membrane component KefB
VNPLLALALLFVAGIAATHLHLPSFPLRRRLSLDLVLAAGAPLVLLGVLLGPGAGVLDRDTLQIFAPVTALGIGWIGAVFGAHLEWRVLRRISRRAWGRAALQATAVLGLTALAAALLARTVPALGAAWRPTVPAVLTLAAAATISGPGAVALVTRLVGVRRSVARRLERAALLDTAFGALVLTLALALHHPHRPFVGVAIGWAKWLGVAAVVGGAVGVLAVWLARLRSDGHELGLDLLGVMLLGSGVAYGADLSPFVVCALAAALIVNRSPDRRRVQGLLQAWEHPIYAVLLVVAGALLHLPTAWLLPAAILLGLVRVAARWATGRFVPGSVGVATVAQGAVAVAVALSFTLVYTGPPPGTVLTTVLLGVALAQAIAGPLMALALRPAPVEVR